VGTASRTTLSSDRWHGNDYFIGLHILENIRKLRSCTAYRDAVDVPPLFQTVVINKSHGLDPQMNIAHDLFGRHGTCHTGSDEDHSEPSCRGITAVRHDEGNANGNAASSDPESSEEYADDRYGAR
jgi:hypothetical protein